MSALLLFMKPFWKPLAGLLAAAALILWAVHAWNTHNDRMYQDGREFEAPRWSVVIDAYKEKARVQELLNASESGRRRGAQQASQQENDHDQATLQTDRPRAASASDGVRRAAAAVANAARSGCPAGNPAPGKVSPPAGDPIGVLADVLGRADARAGLLADYADRARAAGAQCERDYDALTLGAGR
ncbi:MAG: DUF2514 family protein [Pseudomonadota bacterium]